MFVSPPVLFPESDWHWIGSSLLKIFVIPCHLANQRTGDILVCCTGGQQVNDVANLGDL